MEFSTQTTSDGVLVVMLDEENFDAGNVQGFRDKVMNALSLNPFAVLDLAHVHFIDSSGLGAILAAMRRQRDAGGELKLSSLNSGVKAMFELVHIQSMMDIYSTRDEALQSFQD